MIKLNNTLLFFMITLVIGCSGQTFTSHSEQSLYTEIEQLKQQTSVLGEADDFKGSPYPDIAKNGLFETHKTGSNFIAILPNGDDSFAARIQALKNADTSIRIQALVFTGDEAGLYISEILKQKKRQGLDVRVIVDAFSNPKFQTQNMLFDLKQNGIEVEGYEAMLMQWVNEVPLPFLMPHTEPGRLDKRFHEKMWLIDAETDHAIAIVGGLNIANEYFRVEPEKPDFFWRDQDVIVKDKVINNSNNSDSNSVIKDMVTAFDRNFDYFVSIKESRGIFNTNLYWDMTRRVLSTTGKIEFSFKTNPELDKRVRKMAEKTLQLDYHTGNVRFFQNRPRYKETYISQTYLKLILGAQDNIMIANAYFIPSNKIIAALKDAARHCVNITLITNSAETNDLPEITMVGRESYKDLLQVNDEVAVKNCQGEKGIRIFEWQGKRSGTEKRAEGTMHSKYAIFDAKLSLVGSHNLDPRSTYLNSESILVFENKNLAETLTQLFELNDLVFSKQITKEQAKEFFAPENTLYNLEKGLGDWFKNEL